MAARIFFLSVLLAFPVAAEDLTLLGGDLSTTLPGRGALQVAAPNVTDQETRLTQLSGFSVFHAIRTESTGAGPNLVNTGCGRCHLQNGKGRARLFRQRRKHNSMVIKVSLAGLQENGAPIDVPGVGEQLQDRTISGKKRFRTRLRWRRVRGEYADGTRYILRRPLLRFRVPGYKRSEILPSLRLAPALIGEGLIDAIPEAAILALSDPEDSNSDGISGVPQYVPAKRAGGFALGRFGYRASHPTLEQQSAAAAFFDMGVTSDLFGDISTGAELSSDDLNRLVVYEALPGVPMARNQQDPMIKYGQSLFQSIGCNACHTMTFQTESEQYPELDGQTIHPLSDFLLHDMGDGLADERAEFSASGREWKTTPLWGLGFLETVSRVKPRFLHDGRARSIEEAVLWHGGEAQASREAFRNLSSADRNAILSFLKSL